MLLQEAHTRLHAHRQPTDDRTIKRDMTRSIWERYPSLGGG